MFMCLRGIVLALRIKIIMQLNIASVISLVSLKNRSMLCHDDCFSYHLAQQNRASKWDKSQRQTPWQVDGSRVHNMATEDKCDSTCSWAYLSSYMYICITKIRKIPKSAQNDPREPQSTPLSIIHIRCTTRIRLTTIFCSRTINGV